jgi:hypothetical protein
MLPWGWPSRSCCHLVILCGRVTAATSRLPRLDGVSEPIGARMRTRTRTEHTPRHGAGICPCHLGGSNTRGRSMSRFAPPPPSMVKMAWPATVGASRRGQGHIKAAVPVVPCLL